MTRINLVPPSELTTKHLVAEYREIARIPYYVEKSMKRKVPFNISEIPAEFTLGKGHCKFFYDKGAFLSKRFEQIIAEMKRRGFKTNFTDSSIFYINDLMWNDYEPTDSALELSRQRIQERLK
jgi:hypothetical protein